MLTRVSPKSLAHSTVLARLVRWLDPARHAARFEVLTGSSLRVPDATALPGPDVMVVPPGRAATQHPTTALLVVEVAATSLRPGVDVKPPLYAQASVPEYWVVDVPTGRVHVFSAPAGGRYTATTIVALPAPIAPTAIEVTPLQLTGLFDGL